MARTIRLTQGQSAVVCDCHAYLVDGKKWQALYIPKMGGFYAVRREKTNTIFMHALINGTPPGLHTDHIDHNTLDNRCSNLRTATCAQNLANQKLRKTNTSGYRGVHLHKITHRWKATIQVNNKQTHLGYFDTAEDAARAYDVAAREIFGEFANLNFKGENQNG